MWHVTNLAALRSEYSQGKPQHVRQEASLLCVCFACWCKSCLKIQLWLRKHSSGGQRMEVRVQCPRASWLTHSVTSWVDTRDSVTPISFRYNSRGGRCLAGVVCGGLPTSLLSVGQAKAVPPPKLSLDHVVFSFLIRPLRKESRPNPKSKIWQNLISVTPTPHLRTRRMFQCSCTPRTAVRKTKIRPSRCCSLRLARFGLPCLAKAPYLYLQRCTSTKYSSTWYAPVELRISYQSLTSV